MTKPSPTITSPLETQGFAWLDALAEPLQKGVLALFRAGTLGPRVKNLLHGTPVRHRVHPAIIVVPLGAWTTSALLDVLDGLRPRGGYRPAADAAVAMGIISALPAVAAGLADWVDTYDHQRRVGMAHALTNSTALLLYTGSLALRLSQGKPGQGRWAAWTLAGLGFGAVGLGGVLGGELTYTLGVNVTHLLYPKTPVEFMDAMANSELPPGEPRVVEVGRVPVMLVRRDTEITAVQAWCPHAGGPLIDGTFEDNTVVCPWHGSRFCLDDGLPMDGPATAPLRTFDVREQDGRIQVRPNDELRAWPPAPAPPQATPVGPQPG